MSESIQSKGGKAAAARLTPEERSARARAGAEGRKLTAEYEDVLRIGNLQIPCAILSDGRRILSERGTSAAFTHVRSGAEFAKKAAADDGEKLPVFLQSEALNPFISEELRMALCAPIRYQSKKGGVPAVGILAETLPEICEVFLAARRAGIPQTLVLARKTNAAEIMLSGLARVGIVALVDEATGYQRDRDRDALATILEAFVAKELQKWVRTFPPEFYEHMHKLKGWKYDPTSNKRTPLLGTITNEVIYDRLAPGVRKELERSVPKNSQGRKKVKLFQALTSDVGHPKLREHIASVVTIMRLSSSYEDFREKLDVIHPPYVAELP